DRLEGLVRDQGAERLRQPDPGSSHGSGFDADAAGPQALFERRNAGGVVVDDQDLRGPAGAVREEVQAFQLLAEVGGQPKAEDLGRGVALRAGGGSDVREPEQLRLELTELAQECGPIEDRRPENEGCDVVPNARGVRGERGAEPESDEADPRSAAPPPDLVDRAAHVLDPACEAGILNVARRVPAAAIIEAQDREARSRKAGGELDEGAVGTDV